jgi:hypothetical protein
MSAIFGRSATDRSFRAKLLTDPKAALSEFAGHSMPDNFNVKFVERAGDVTIVLPNAVGGAAELSDAELETVAGGVTPTVAAACAASSAECIASALWVATAIVSWFD